MQRNEDLKTCLAMTVTKRNLSGWIINVVLLLTLFNGLPYVTAQASNDATDDFSKTRLNVPVAVVIMILLIVLFVVGLFSIFWRQRGNQGNLRAAETVFEGGIMRSRRAARGLDVEVIESFPSFQYSEVKGLKIGKGALECAVCLSEFEDEDTLRMMPPCSHVFHAVCIDVWLSSRITCPLCRAVLVTKPGESFPHTVIQIPETNTNPVPEPERECNDSNTGGRVLESADVRLMNSVTWNAQNRPPRSRSTGMSNWGVTRLFVPRSHSTGHTLVQPGANLEKFTLRLPEEVRNHLMKATLERTKSKTTLPQARSSRRGYRSGSIRGERSALSYEQLGDHRRAYSLASLRAGSVREQPLKWSFKPTKSSFGQNIGEQPSAPLRTDGQV